MSWIYFAIASHLLFAIVFALDKVILKTSLSPWRYTIVLGLLSGASVFLAPFVGITSLSLYVIEVGLLAGVAFVAGVYLYFRILQHYEVSWVAPLLFGVFIPIFTFLFSYILLGERLVLFHVLALILLLFGGFFLSFSRRYRASAAGLLLLAGMFVGLEFTLTKVLFNETNFWTGYVISRIGAFAVVLFLLTWNFIFPRFSARVASSRNLHFAHTSQYPIKKFRAYSVALIVGVKQVFSIAASLLLQYSISLGSPTLVNGLGGVRYAFLFVIALLLARQWPWLMDEPFSRGAYIRKIIALVLVVFGVLLLLAPSAVLPGARVWGVTFSPIYARELGLDVRNVFLETLDDLGIREFRLIAYWSEIERERGYYDFSELDFELDSVAARGGTAVVAMGVRLPRWAECHEPGWVKTEDVRVKTDAFMQYLTATVERYNTHPAVWAWQIENEPFLGGFGECTGWHESLLDTELDLVRSLSAKPVIITDSGELGRWYKAYVRSDVFGTTMYRVIWNKNIPGGYFEYPLGPDFFVHKAGLMHMLFGEKPMVNIELQAEPWTHRRPWETPLEEQFKAFDVAQFRLNVEYAQDVGFEKNYLWGVEWWYWMKEKQYHPEFWEYAKTLF